jgi:hypothetical protein
MLRAAFSFRFSYQPLSAPQWYRPVMAPVTISMRVSIGESPRLPF